MDIWEKLYQEARRVQGNRVISPFIEAGGVAAALLTNPSTASLPRKSANASMYPTKPCAGISRHCSP